MKLYKLLILLVAISSFSHVKAQEAYAYLRGPEQLNSKEAKEFEFTATFVNNSNNVLRMLDAFGKFNDYNQNCFVTLKKGGLPIDIPPDGKYTVTARLGNECVGKSELRVSFVYNDKLGNKKTTNASMYVNIVPLVNVSPAGTIEMGDMHLNQERKAIITLTNNSDFVLVKNPNIFMRREIAMISLEDTLKPGQTAKVELPVRTCYPCLLGDTFVQQYLICYKTLNNWRDFTIPVTVKIPIKPKLLKKDSAKYTPRMPYVRFDSVKCDLGTYKAGEPAEHIFWFTNISGFNVHINQVMSSCGCLSPSYDKQLIPPGDRGQIKGSYDSNRIGPYTKSMTVQVGLEIPCKNNYEQETIVIICKGNVLSE
jgi:hypothetical protein